MFRGSSFHNLDAKGRLIIPARFRDVLKQSSVDGVMVSKMDGALFCYTFEQWRKIEERILNLSVKSENMRRFRRIFIGGAHECFLDKQARILIPPSLRQYAGLNKEIVLVGVLDHFEIWAKESWMEEDARLQNDIKNEDVRNEVAELGL
ncbi:MAG: division/cell wall cluster transcriptional repressor MraZ [Deltaproteobacteria bacterium]|nr:division/cell wall cluster transcriptional repressor MraZ [Deltaproteobacteria bacterium]MBW2018553.1 division/cell wall cluster transcriptional repressor MraZ [Deltaproteobacteria bacterium]MBW2073288.1 division/cell wall cluster transcriptional repressor MraZ [Deltaproteobacteria bacterium]RLB83340.1 MAG: division/cell wall cluster transcriptional repressor MraZ [Deltaproteobacteria bacterium]